MIHGRVSANRDAIIELQILSSTQKDEIVEAVIDTGFNGYLTLPADLVRRLKLQPAGNRRATLGDGTSVVLEVFLAEVIWYGLEREVLVLQAEGGPLIGMSFLYGNRVTMTIINGGDVTIEPLL